jgi:hypothetical protein
MATEAEARGNHGGLGASQHATRSNPDIDVMSNSEADEGTALGPESSTEEAETTEPKATANFIVSDAIESLPTAISDAEDFAETDGDLNDDEWLTEGESPLLTANMSRSGQGRWWGRYKAAVMTGAPRDMLLGMLLGVVLTITVFGLVSILRPDHVVTGSLATHEGLVRTRAISKRSLYLEGIATAVDSTAQPVVVDGTLRTLGLSLMA